MTRGRKIVISAGIVLFGSIVAGVVLTSLPAGAGTTPIAGAVLERASDPQRETPVPNAEITVTSALARAVTKSDVSGLFRVTLPPGVKPSQAVTLTVVHSGYHPFEITAPITDKIYLVRLTPIHPAATTIEAQTAETVVRDLRVRYSVKTAAIMNVGSFARTFQIAGAGGIPCNGQAPCSPDGNWKAVLGSVSYDAGEGNEFKEVRVSCIGGPCPFTAIQRNSLVNSGRVLKVSALNWSDTTTFLIEAEVTRSQVSDAIRYSIPVVFGNGMDFTLPGTAEGPSIEADLNASEIVFPLGPKLLLSWAVCTLKTDADGFKLYRCELKPGYRFQ